MKVLIDEDCSPKDAILIAALEEYRQRRELSHVLRLTRETGEDHRGLLDRLGDAWASGA